MLYLLFAFFVNCSASQWIRDLNLPPRLLEYSVVNYANLREKCKNDETCKIDVDQKICFGHEEWCLRNDSMASNQRLLQCQKNLNPKVVDQYFEQADFGYLKSRKFEHVICDSKSEEKSYLKCSKHLANCVGKNLFFDFSNLNMKTSKRYRDDVIQKGQIGGNCDNFDEVLLAENSKQKGFLTTWADELQHFESRQEFRVSSEYCDVIFEKPTIMMKLDAATNLYHHFCDFINLYASLHLNETFEQDVDIIWYDTHPDGFIDKLYGVVWKAFSKNQPIELKTLDQKRVCFKDLLLPLLARQINGLFYNMPLTQGCSGSAFVKSFSDFLLHRLSIAKSQPLLDDVRVVILTRSTSFRRILNIQEVRFANEQVNKGNNRKTTRYVQIKQKKNI
ncbi:unnamed protein product [Caenorhabditis bovis]|uniref:DUF19 domain-containing protein n=1 Tax=Caenorhabditis bovis TaxID=2654633 RepID=A0A8S1E0E7_9PELO|nr:unnamed protein product [Caenorhabditis bovis]